MNSENGEEDFLWRPPPKMPYRRSTEVLEISEQVIQATLGVFRAYAVRRLESCCFWYGVRAGNCARVFGVAIPRQRNSWGNYHVTGDAMAAVSNSTQAFGWKNLSQLHTHPGESVEHSRYDDEHANSRRALSIVIPNYGLWRGKWPLGIGVHDFQNDYWYLLNDGQSRVRIQVIQDFGQIRLVDTR